MPVRLQMPNGDIITARDEASIPAAVAQYRDMVYKEHGYDPNAKGKTDEQAVEEANQRWLNDPKNPSIRAAIGGGMANLGRNIKNMTGFMSDDELKTLQATDRALRDQHGVAYTTGEIAPTLLLGAAGRALPATARLMAAAPKTAAMAEGALVGGATAGPDNRGTGAVLGAATGGLLSGLGQAAGRVGRGVAPPTQDALQMAADTAAPIGAKGMEVPFVPVSRAAATTGPGETTRWVYDSILRNFPKGARNLNAQTEEAGEATIRNLLRRAYKGKADDVIAEWKATGRLDRGLALGETLTQDKSTQAVRGILLRAAQHTKNRGTPSLQEIAKFARESGELGKKTVTQLRESTELAGDVLSNTVKGEGSVAARDVVYKIIGKIGNLMVVPNQLAGLMTRKGFQKFLMGNTKWQTQMNTAMRRKDVAMVKRLMGEAARNYAASRGDGPGNRGVRGAVKSYDVATTAASDAVSSGAQAARELLGEDDVQRR